MSYNKETGMYEGYIYVILNDVHPDKIYVGQTSQTPEGRWRGHIHQVRKHTYTDKLHNAMDKYGIEHFGMDIVEMCKSDTKQGLKCFLNEKERYYVKLFNSYQDGYNLTTGGDSAEHTARKVKRYSLDGIFIKEYPSIESLKVEFDSVSTIYDCCMGNCKYAYGSIWRYAEDALDTYELPTEVEKKEALFRYRLLTEQIIQYDYRGNIVRIFDNVAQVRENIEISQVKLRSCLNGHCIHHKTFVYRFYNDSFNTYNTFSSKPKLVEKRDLNGNLLDVYESVREAGRQNDCAYQTIQGVCAGKRKTASGYLWTYVEESFVMPDLRNKRRCVKVYKYDKTTYELLHIYNSIKEASQDNNVSIQTISRIARGIRNASRSQFVWAFKELNDFEIDQIKINKTSKPVNQYTLDGIFVQSYESIKSAGTCNDYNEMPICQCCLKKQNTAYGYKWYYMNDQEQPDKSKIITK